MTTPSKQPAWLREAVFYQVYPQSFADSNGDGIGDLPGLIARLEYLRRLGVTALWLNPVFESPFGDAGYDVTDYRRVAPRYGTNEDLERLFREAHARGMRVVLDLVAGHTSDRHPWFREACRAEPNRYSNYYHFTGDEALPSFVGGPAAVSPGPRPGHVLANFYPFQPALNYGWRDPDPARPWQLPPDHPDCLAVREEMREIMRFWLDRGCDGFRVDMASSLVKNDPEAVELTRLWRGFRAWLDRDYPEAVLVAEWGHPEQAVGAGFHVDFLLHFGEPAYVHLVGPENAVDGGARRPHVFFERAGEGDITLFLDNYLRHLRATEGRGYISLPTGNHDFPRASRGRDADELRVLYTMLFTLPGVPFLYYGDEIGLRELEGLPPKEGAMTRSGCRAPMAWRPGAPNRGFSTAPPADLYLPMDPSPDGPTVEEQEKDRGSLLHAVRRLVALRREHTALGNDGAFRPLHAAPGAYPFVYERADGAGRYAVVVHPAASPCSLTLPALKGARRVFGRGVRITGRRIAAAGVSAAVFRLAGG